MQSEAVATLLDTESIFIQLLEAFPGLIREGLRLAVSLSGERLEAALAMAGYQHVCPLVYWSESEAAVVRTHIANSLDDETMEWLEEAAPAVVASEMVCLGVLLGLRRTDVIDDQELLLADAHSAGFVMLHVPELQEQYARAGLP